MNFISEPVTQKDIDEMLKSCGAFKKGKSRKRSNIPVEIFDYCKWLKNYEYG